MNASLVLFDIDGTLTRGAGPHHRRALEEAVQKIAGVPATTDGIPVHGMLDNVILTLMLRASGVSDAEATRLLPLVMETAQEIYPRLDVPELHDKRCPGVPRILEEMARRDIVLALVTGNLTRIAWHKLSRAGIHHHFRFGAFGEMAPTRGDLAKMAIAQARREHLIGPNSRITLIGDAITDVQAARDAGIRSVAVRTGITPHEDLIAAAPDVLLEDLTSLDLGII